MHRRHVLAGIPLLWLANSELAKAELQKQKIDDLVSELAKNLELTYGGQWHCRRDNELLMMKRV